MPILGTTNKYASWPAKVDHEAHSCNFSLYVRMNGGGDPSPSILTPKSIWIGWPEAVSQPGWPGNPFVILSEKTRV